MAKKKKDLVPANMRADMTLPTANIEEAFKKATADLRIPESLLPTAEWIRDTLVGGGKHGDKVATIAAHRYAWVAVACIAYLRAYDKGEGKALVDAFNALSLAIKEAGIWTRGY